jgi:phytoene dehydrogenase-like protein
MTPGEWTVVAATVLLAVASLLTWYTLPRSVVLDAGIRRTFTAWSGGYSPTTLLPLVFGIAIALPTVLGRLADLQLPERIGGIRCTQLRLLLAAGAVLLAVTPAQLVALSGDDLPSLRRRRMEGWEYGPATFKVDFALSDPVPWKAPEVARTATVHLGNTFEEIAAGEGAAWEGRLDPRPFVLATQPSLFDDTRAPAGRHTLWAYCHVPQGFDGDATDAIEGQIERFAPGFRKTILAKHAMGPADFERYNPNNVGGSIAGGAVTLGQLFARPFPTPWPYTTGIDDVYLCSSSTSPGAGAHGMCG